MHNTGTYHAPTSKRETAEVFAGGDQTGQKAGGREQEAGRRSARGICLAWTVEPARRLASLGVRGASARRDPHCGAATMMKPGRPWTVMRQSTLMLVLLGAAVSLVTMASAATMPSPAPADGRRRASVAAAVHVAGLPCQSAVCRLRGGQGDGESMASTPGRARSISPPRSASPPRPKAADAKAAKGSKLKAPGGAEAPAVRIASVQSRTRMYASSLLCYASTCWTDVDMHLLAMICWPMAAFALFRMARSRRLARNRRLVPTERACSFPSAESTGF